MRSFRSDMMQKQLPNTTKEVITSIVPPNDIKRGKNTKGSEIFDGEKMEGEVEEDK